MVQYVSDNSGKTTAVLIPIEEWDAILKKHSDLRDLGESAPKEKKMNPSDFKGIFSKEEAQEFHRYLAKAAH